VSDEPRTIMLAQIAKLIAGLGIATDVKDIRSIRMVPGKVELVRYRLTDDGRHFIAGDVVATETVVIAIEQRWEATRPLPRAARYRRWAARYWLAGLGLLAAVIAVVATVLGVVTA
jgi:hypothetical protein